MKHQFAFIGTGNMAFAIIGGLVANADVKKSSIILFDKNTAQYEKFGEGYIFADSAAEAASRAEILVLAVKPQNYAEVLSELAEVNLDGKLIVPIAAGISTAYIESFVGKCAVVRTMPNTPLLVGKGLTALCKNASVTDEAFALVDAMFSASGTTIHLPESDMNKIIAATSSSPAYMFLIIKAICDGAAAQGIVCDDLRNAVCDMMIGSATLARESKLSLEELIRMVCSPKGTTERAMQVLYDAGLEQIFRDAMDACTKRADELAAK